MRWTEQELEAYQAKRRGAATSRQAGESTDNAARQEISQPRREKNAQIIRQSGKEPNKTEKRFLNEYLKPWLFSGEIDEIGDHESITLRLANGLRFSPDWPTWKDGKLTFYEVKGAHIREDAIVKLKQAPGKYKQFRFVLYQYVKREWLVQEVLA